MPRSKEILPFGYYDIDPRFLGLIGEDKSPLDYVIQIAYQTEDNTARPLVGATPTTGAGGFWEVWRSYDPDDLEEEFDAPWSPDLTASGKEIYLHRLKEDLERLPRGKYTVRVFSPTRKEDGETGWISTPLRDSDGPHDEIVERVGELLDAAPTLEGTDRYRRFDRPKNNAAFFVMKGGEK